VTDGAAWWWCRRGLGFGLGLSKALTAVNCEASCASMAALRVLAVALAASAVLVVAVERLACVFGASAARAGDGRSSARVTTNAAPNAASTQTKAVPAKRMARF
jgi:hypothetical protein